MPTHGGTSNKRGFCLEKPNFPVKDHLYKKLFRLTWKNFGSYTGFFPVSECLYIQNFI